MDFELTKNEIRINKYGGFYIPIHPILLNPSSSFDRDLARKTFTKIPSEWHDDLNTYLESPEGRKDENREFYAREFLGRKKPTVIEELREQRLDTPPWRDNVFTDKRGFATSLMISRNSGGSLYYSQGDSCCEKGIELEGEDNIFFKLSKEKISQLIHGRFENYGELRVYAHHNVDFFPGALFLRNWALAYVNAAIASI